MKPSILTSGMSVINTDLREIYNKNNKQWSLYIDSHRSMQSIEFNKKYSISLPDIKHHGRLYHTVQGPTHIRI